MAESYSTRPDAMHRHMPGVLAVGCIAVLVMTLVTGVNRYGSSTSLLVVLFGAIASSVAWYGGRNERLTVTDEGVTLHGWFSAESVRFVEIGSYKFRASDRRPFDFGDLVDVIVRFFAFFTVRPVRWLIRLALHGKRERGFLDGRLGLFDRGGEERMVIKGSTRFVGVHEALDRIIAGIHAAGVDPFMIVIDDETIGLDTIESVAIEDAEITLRSGGHDRELACWDVPNVFLVLEAVATRGGTITLESDVYLPSALSTRLGS